MNRGTIAAALAGTLAGCAPQPPDRDPLAVATDARLRMARSAMDRAETDYRTEIQRAQDTCRRLYPPLAANAPGAARERRVAEVMDCFDQRALGARGRLDQRLAEAEREFQAGAARDAAIMGGPPLGSAGNPVWIRPIR